MKNPLTARYRRCMMIVLTVVTSYFGMTPLTGFSQGLIANRVAELKQSVAFKEKLSPFTLSKKQADKSLSAIVSKYGLLDFNAGLKTILVDQPPYLSLEIPSANPAENFQLLLYKVNISPTGFHLLTSDNNSLPGGSSLVHYRGAIDNDPFSVASFSFSETGTMGMISNNNGNYVMGKLQGNEEQFIIYNDKDLIPQNNFSCGTKTAVLPGAGQVNRPGNSISTSSSSLLTANCVNWYWETDYDVFVNKGSLLNVNNYMQGVFNQVATLYANDGISINLKTLFVWTSADPYTGPSAGNYLTQFGNYRTTWNGDLAHLIGFAGNGGVAYVNGIQMCEYGIGQVSSQMAYSGISSSYSTVPTYSWTVGCITHEQGHQLGSNHTHDCVWNGNNTKIDDCGGTAGYSGGTCLPQPNPLLPVGGGTIMSYCHLTSAGTNFNLGFGTQPKNLIINKINASTCLTGCAACSVPAQPGSISGNGTACASSSQSYSVSSVTGATGYTWTIPAGWSGNSTTNSITVTAGTSGGSITVTANNTCGNSTPRTLPVLTRAVPSQPGVIAGNTVVYPAITESYSISTVPEATSYSWTLPATWSGGSSLNSISTTTGNSGGNIEVRATNNCGSSLARTLPITVGIVVPVTLLNFHGQLLNNSTVLSWQTMQEFGAFSYVIERSQDGSLYDSIGNVLANGNTTLNEYTFIDNNPYPGISYYRLKLVDRDGSLTFSNIVQVKNAETVITRCMIYPNPTSSRINIKVMSSTRQRIIIGLYDASGKKIQEKTMEARNETNETFSNLSGLAQGTYFLLFRNEQGQVLHKTSFIKL